MGDALREEIHRQYIDTARNIAMIYKEVKMREREKVEADLEEEAVLAGEWLDHRCNPDNLWIPAMRCRYWDLRLAREAANKDDPYATPGEIRALADRLESRDGYKPEQLESMAANLRHLADRVEARESTSEPEHEEGRELWVRGTVHNYAEELGGGFSVQIINGNGVASRVDPRPEDICTEDDPYIAASIYFERGASATISLTRRTGTP